jgi:hypothetical protein
MIFIDLSLIDRGMVSPNTQAVITHSPANCHRHDRIAGAAIRNAR